MNKSANSWYHVAFNNCVHAVSDALKVAGLNIGHSMYEATIWPTIKPNHRFWLIKKYNKESISDGAYESETERNSTNSSNQTSGRPIIDVINEYVDNGGTVYVVE